MNAAQIHLALNHAPLLLSVVGGGVLLFGMLRKNDSFKALSLYFLVAAAIFTAPVFLTGEGTEEMIEHLPGVNEGTIERHENMAKISLAIIIVTGVLALAGLLFRRKAIFGRLLLISTVVLSLASFGAMAKTAHLGGLIRHSEIQNSALANAKEKETKDEEKKSSHGNDNPVKEEDD